MKRGQALNPMRAASLTPNLFMGGDREVTMILLMFCVTLGLFSFFAMAWEGIGIALVSYFTVLAVLRQMAKSDPLTRHIYMRYIRYKNYYPACGSPYAEDVKRQET